MPIDQQPSNNAPTKRRRGRPRKAEGGTSHTKKLILATAIDLFRKQGYQKTSMTQIARSVGLDQSSIYYYFSSKEDILFAFLDLSNLGKIMRSIADSDISCAERLYSLIVHDVVAKCELPFDFIEFEELAAHKPESFQELIDLYKILYEALVNVIREGAETGEFVTDDPDRAAVFILSINEGLQHHYHAKLRDQLILEQAGYTVRNLTTEQIGDVSARATMPGLAKEPFDFEELFRRSQKNYASIMADIHDID